MDNIWKSFTYQRPPVVRELKGRENEGDGSLRKRSQSGCGRTPWNVSPLTAEGGCGG